MLSWYSAQAQTVLTSAQQRWSTYLGGTGPDQVLSIATDLFGHVYVAGRTSNGLLLGNDTTGQSGLTHQNTHGGGTSDAFLAKIAPHGSVLWCTYFGGEGEDEAVAVVVTDMSGVYLIGNTTSAQGIATDTLAYQTTAGGGSDLFIARFTEYGALESATYFGAADDERASASVLDNYGRLLVGGSTNGPECLAGIDAPQPYAVGTDGILLRFHGTGSLIAGTFVGGEGEDHSLKLAQGDSTGYILAGNTTSTTGLATAGALTATWQGGTDAFLLKVDTALVVLYGTYIGGTEDDTMYGLVQRQGIIALCGLSYSDTLYTDSTSMQPTNAGGGDGFLVVLSDQLQLAWCTFLGATAYDALTAVDIDLAGRSYAAGVTASDSIWANGSDTNGFLQGPTDAFILRFNEPNTLAWARYVGALGEEEAHAFCVKGNTSLFLGGSTTSSEDLAMNGHQMEYGGGDTDGAAYRLDQVESTICEGICMGNSSNTGSGGSYNGVTPPLNELHVCLGEPVTMIVFGGALGANAEWMWYADECGQPDSYMTMGDTITFTPTASFTLYVRAESLAHTTPCRNIQIVVHAYPEPQYSVTDTVCPGAPIQLQGTDAEWFTWALGDTLLTGAQALLTAPSQAGTVIVEMTATNGPACSVVTPIAVEVLPAPTPVWSITDVSCHGGTDGSIGLQAGSDTLYTLVWLNTAPVELPLEGFGAGVYVLTVTDSLGCSHTDSLSVSMPVALMDSVSITPALCGDATGALEVHGQSTSPGIDLLLGTEPLIDNAMSGLVPGNYIVHASDSAGCMEQIAITILDLGSIHVSAGDTLMAEGGTGVLQAFITPFDSAATYQWSPPYGLEDPTAQTTAYQVTDTLLYVITAISGAGCEATDSVWVMPFFPEVPEVPDPCGDVFLPTLFSPNNDGTNDLFCMYGNCYTTVALMVYDRWGQRIFSTTDPEACWDGQLNGTPLPTGIYAVTFSALRGTGEQVEHQGTITLRR
jgi:gliding motility-associated-like protein